MGLASCCSTPRLLCDTKQRIQFHLITTVRQALWLLYPVVFAGYCLAVLYRVRYADSSSHPFLDTTNHCLFNQI